MADERRQLLIVTDVVTGYGRKQVLNGVTMVICPGQIVAIIGHNGAGKSTILKALFGMLPIWSGRVILDDLPLEQATPSRLLSNGVAYVPQGNRVFTHLTVRENLEVARLSLSDGTHHSERIERILGLFPALNGRLKQKAGALSGGEKQMLSLASALVFAPRLLLLDEPSLGLSPRLVTEALGRIRQMSRDSGTAVLIVEQKVREVLKIAEHVYVLRNGHISYSGAAEPLQDDAMLARVYL